MDKRRLQKAIFLAVTVPVIAVIAYFTGIKAAEAVRDFKARGQQAKQTEAVLKEMGSGLGVGKLLPDAVLADLEGIDTRLSDLLCDQTLIVFFGPACSFSQTELASIKALRPTPQEQACIILISSADQTELWGIKSKLDLSCPLLYDRDSSYGKTLGIKGVPLNFVVDKTLTIRKVVSGAMPQSAIREILAQSKKL